MSKSVMSNHISRFYSSRYLSPLFLKRK